MESLGNANNNTSVVGYCIFDSNHGNALVLNIKPLDINCAPSVGEEQVSKFENVFYAVRLTCLTAQSNKEYYVYIIQRPDKYIS